MLAQLVATAIKFVAMLEPRNLYLVASKGVNIFSSELSFIPKRTHETETKFKVIVLSIFVEIDATVL